MRQSQSQHNAVWHRAFTFFVENPTIILQKLHTKDQGGVCLGFFELSIEKSQQIETKGRLWTLALPKPKQVIGIHREARFEVLPAAFP
jgi:hypothetical protein